MSESPFAAAATVFVADCHLDARPATLDPFLGLLRAMRGWVPSLYLLGDLFNLWVALPHLEDEYHGRILLALGELRASGTKVHFVEGNRDFFGGRRDDLVPHRGGPGRLTPFSTWSEQEAACEAAGRRIALVHGDKVNRDDRRYLRWNAFSKGKFAFWLANRLPSGFGKALIHDMEHRMRSSNPGYKMGNLPEAWCRRYAEAKFAEGFGAVVMGHFHQERRIAMPGGELLVMPMWGETRRYLVLREDGRLEFETFAG